MSRRQTSLRLVAVASEAKVAHDKLTDLSQAVSSLLQSWAFIPEEDRKAALLQAFMSNPPGTITNALEELAHYRLDGKRIARERVRQQAKASNEGRLVTSEAPDIHPYPKPRAETTDDLAPPTAAEQEEYDNWMRGKQ